MFLGVDAFGEPGMPENARLVADRPEIAEAVDTVQRVILAVFLTALAFVLVRRYLRASAPLRRVLAPVLAGAGGVSLLTLVYVLDKLDVRRSSSTTPG